MYPKDRHIRIHSRLDHRETVSSFAEKYQQVGWILQAVDPRDGTDLEVNFGVHPETWVNRLWEPGLSGPKINFEVHTGKQSGLMVLEVAKGLGESNLDQYGPWRAECIAALGAIREQHFYAWGPSPLFDSVSCLATPEIRWFGEGQAVPVPPAFDLEMQATWRWLTPPWDKPPQYPSQSLSFFLEQHLTREPQPRPEASLSWQEVYCLASPFEPLLQALSAPCPSMQNYYQGIIEAAMAAAIKSPEALLSLLWHALGGMPGNTRPSGAICRNWWPRSKISQARQLPREMTLGICFWIMPLLWQEKLRPADQVNQLVNRGRRFFFRDVWLNSFNLGQ